MNTSQAPSCLRKKPVSRQLQYSAFIFLFFLARFLLFATDREVFFSPSISVYYLLNYQLGFIPRALIGSFVSLFTDYLTQDTIYIFSAAAVLSTFIVVSLMLGKALQKAENEWRPGVAFFLLLLLSAPLSHTNLVERHFGRLDIYLLFITLVALWCMNKPGLRWVIPVLCFTAVAVHPGYMVTYLPALAIPLLYEVVRSKHSAGSIALFALSCLVLGAAFLYFQFFPPQVPFPDAEALGKYLSQSTDMKIYTPVLYAEYFDPFLSAPGHPDYLLDVNIPIARNMAAPVLSVFSAFSFPLVFIFGAVWIGSIRRAGSKWMKPVFVLCALAPLAFIPAALFAHDWDRWWAAAINCQFIMLFYFIVRRDVSVIDSVKRIYAYFERHMLVMLCIFIFYATLMLSNICSFPLNIFDKSLWHDFFAQVLQNYDDTM